MKRARFTWAMAMPGSADLKIPQVPAELERKTDYDNIPIKTQRVFKEIQAAFRRAVESGMPYVVEIILERETDCSMGVAIDAIREFE